jgi:Subtilase family
MKWFFEPPYGGDGSGIGPPHGGDGSGTGPGLDNDAAPGLIGLPEAVRLRHGVRVLDPEAAEVVPGVSFDQEIQPTVYRPRTLLVPGDLLRSPAAVAAINRVLESTGMRLVAPEEDTEEDAGEDRGEGALFQVLRDLPRPAVLAPTGTAPVVIDAWKALQTLRAAAGALQRAGADETGTDEAAPGSRAGAGADETVPGSRAGLDEAVVWRISLEHLLVGSAITGSPIDNGPGGIAGGSGSSSGGVGPTTTDSYLFSGGDPRTPVAVVLDPPRRRSAGECRADYGRRPVVAVLDTGVRAHPWLDVTGDPGGGYDLAADGFVTVDYAIQDAIRRAGEHARDHGDRPRQVIRDPWDAPVAENPLVGELSPALGHGTFIAGIVRQVVPDARVLAVRIIHSDDVCYEGDVICALRHLATRIALAEEDDPAAMVDVVSLSFGYFAESAADLVLTSGLWQAIEILLDLGVVVVAAAGNYSTSRPFYPAAFAIQTAPVPVISVGALNPNGTKAVFSNDGNWVTAWAQGAAVVSAYPVDANASRTPELRVRASARTDRESLDPDDYSGGFAVWSGTSFSAPGLAALIAGSLLGGAAGDGLRLDQPGVQAARERAAAAVANLRGEHGA